MNDACFLVFISIAATGVENMVPTLTGDYAVSFLMSGKRKGKTKCLSLRVSNSTHCTLAVYLGYAQKNVPKILPK